MALTKISRAILDTGISDSSDATAITIDSSENVGIGTTTPSQILNVEATSTPVIEVSTLDDNNPASASAIDLVEKQPTHASNTATFGQSGVYGYRIQLNGSDNTLRIKSGSQTTVTDRVTLQRDTGNVGIGETSPDRNLVVKSTSTSAAIKLVNSSSTALSMINFTNANVDFGNSHATGNLTLYTNNGNANMIMSDTGNLYLTGGNDRRIKLSDSGIAGESDSNNTVHIRGDNDFLKLMAAGNGGLIYEEDGTEHLSIASGGQLKFNAGFGSSGKAYGVRAWVNFNGTGTVAIRDSGNVSSITDGGTGDYSVNFTTAMPDANYAILGSAGHTSASNLIALTVNHVSGSLPATGSVHVYTAYQNTYAFDSVNVSVAIVR